MSIKKPVRVVAKKVLDQKANDSNQKANDKLALMFLKGVLSTSFILETIHEWDVTGKHRGFVTKLLAEAEARRAKAEWQANLSKVLSNIGI